MRKEKSPYDGAPRDPCADPDVYNRKVDLGEFDLSELNSAFQAVARGDINRADKYLAPDCRARISRLSMIKGRTGQVIRIDLEEGYIIPPPGR